MPAQAELKVKNSRFVADVVACTAVSDAKNFVTSVRRREKNANHVCYAFRIGLEGTLFRTDDDGEPAGTAGQPILRAIDSAEVTNCIVTVARYFGGIKLGKGGLIRAYGKAAREVLSIAEIQESKRTVTANLEFGYDRSGEVQSVIVGFEGEVLNAIYLEATTLTVAIAPDDVDGFTAAFLNAVKGKGTINITD